MKLFELQHKDEHTTARAGVIHTDHGDIETPAFMPVGTQGSVKTLDQEDLETIGAQIILGNTYHLHLRPGEDLIDQAGGLHRFINRNKPILTDSGGFQVFSLGLQKDKRATGEGAANQNAKLVDIDDDGVTFQSHIDGSQHRFTPEAAIEIQHKLGADIIMAFDECTPNGIEERYVRDAMERTHRWAERSLAAHTKETARHGYRQFLFGIIQGSHYRHLREESARCIASLDFDGIAIGGESIGYNMLATADILDWVYPLIPEGKPHYAMGVGLSPSDLLIAVEHGADMFDCVAPTRLARHGMLFVHPAVNNKQRINITNAAFEKDFSPIDPACGCPTCRTYTRAYLHHLFNAQEISAMRLASIHNLYFMIHLMNQTRQAIQENNFDELRKQWL